MADWLDADVKHDAQALKDRLAKHRVWILLGLTLLACLPRMLVAWRLNVFCHDGYYYCGRSNAAKPLLDAFDLSLYPVILALGHRLGMSWSATAQILGVAVGSLLVLPLYGAVRRLFDEPIAVLSCILYAVHPEMIEQSAEPIRDATFWFFTTFWLYFTVRSWREVRWRWFLAAGVAFALAAHTRTEGWLLLCIPGLWVLRDIVQRRPERFRIAAGAGLILAVTPA